ncbi:momilactone A synthase-like [Canna indica]|uniref:Momilactone A synthase-like n=1 Tax=Canna indica TaxID=4628 RepID=A0AAQ3JQW8_9LILI|nr:momilactone A synthase-like [Canna indica]
MQGAPLLFSVAKRLESKVALITGAASGIGAATAKLFAHYGAKLVLADVQDDKGRALCSALGPSVASYVHCDVTHELDVERAVNAAVARHGKLDIMFSNAGIIGEPCLRLLESSKTDFERVISTNLVGGYLATKHAARVMLQARRGSIVITASVASVIASMTPVAYTCSKHAVVGLMKSAALELGQFGVRVNCVSPYALPTPLATKAFGMGEEELTENMEEHAILKGVRLKAEDVAEAVAYLAGDESRYVNGLNLIVDGGFSTGNPSHGLFRYSIPGDER